MNKQGTIVQAWGGHLVDLYRLLRFDIRNPHSYSKYRNIVALRRRTGAHVLVEAGTYLGNTTCRCSRIFDKVVTIELDTLLYKQASQYLASRKNVECVHGDALRELPRILARDNLDKILIFLDGHYSGSNTALGDLLEPACEVIKSLKPHLHKIVGIVVDDFREFGSNGWPSRSSLLQEIEKIFGRRL